MSVSGAQSRLDIALQLGLYVMVGGVASCIDVGGFSLGRDLGLAVWVAKPLSFVCGTAFNYVASYWIAFERGRHGRVEELGRMVAVVCVGMVLNGAATLMGIGAGLSELQASMLAIGLVFPWNFFGRKWLVFHAHLPESSRRVADRVLGERGRSEVNDHVG